MELYGQSFEVIKKICYLGYILGDGGGVVGCTLARTRNGWAKIRALLHLPPSRGLACRAKCLKM